MRVEPIIFEDEARQRAPNFRRGREEPCCYRCLHCWPIKNVWACQKHTITFGNIARTNSYFAMIRYVCDDYERGRKVEE